MLTVTWSGIKHLRGKQKTNCVQFAIIITVEPAPRIVQIRGVLILGAGGVFEILNTEISSFQKFGIERFHCTCVTFLVMSSHSNP